MKSKVMALMGMCWMLAACASHEAGAEGGEVQRVDPEEVRAALLQMIGGSGNKWMGEELAEGKIVGEGAEYRIGRWTFSVEQMRFDFVHQNRDVTPPIYFEIYGVLERKGGRLVARVTGNRQT